MSEVIDDSLVYYPRGHLKYNFKKPFFTHKYCKSCNLIKELFSFKIIKDKRWPNTHYYSNKCKHCDSLRIKAYKRQYKLKKNII